MLVIAPLLLQKSFVDVHTIWNKSSVRFLIVLLFFVNLEIVNLIVWNLKNELGYGFVSQPTCR